MINKVYRIDRQKERKTIVVASLILFILLAVVGALGYTLAGLFGPRDGVIKIVILVAFLAAYGLVQFIILQNSRTDVTCWALDIIDEDHFIISNTRHVAVPYARENISKIDLRDPESIFFHIRSGKKVFVHSNLERYEEIVAYFRGMQARLKADQRSGG